MTKRDRRFLYYARSGVLEGIARIIDIGNALNHYPRFRTASEADAFALRSDWVMIGRDIRQAIGEYAEAEEKEHSTVS